MKNGKIVKLIRTVAERLENVSGVELTDRETGEKIHISRREVLAMQSATCAASTIFSGSVSAEPDTLMQALFGTHGDNIQRDAAADHEN